jgi:RimJ/RimL family protein N-acetyltransferase
VFSSAVTDHWIRDVAEDAGFHVVVDASLAENRSVSLLRVSGGPTILAVTPARAAAIGLPVTEDDVHTRIAAAGITLNDPDYLFYLPTHEQSALLSERVPDGTRQLTSDDRAAFERFAAEAPEDDLDEAFVELDHWLAFGTLVDGRLVAAASMYPWDGSLLADLGVITLPEFRGRGLGRATVRAMSARALELGHEPQYRCQLDNAPSVALAAASGFELFGEWEVIVGGQ